MVGPSTKFSDSLHAEKYRSNGESFRESMNRIANALTNNAKEYHELREILGKMRFLPGGRIQSTIGSTKNTTCFNCFVSGTIEDSFIDGHGSIMSRAAEAAATMRMGGGIGYDFSTLRPKGALIKKLQSKSSGPISFMGIYNEICLCIASSGHRRGAQMGILRIDHPDIEEFIHAKQNKTQLSGFNTSIAVTDEFMECLNKQKAFKLRFQNETYKEVDAVELWENIMRSTWDWAEPGVLFIDHINDGNNLKYCETIAATNPCFTGDTKVCTEKGPKTFKELASTGKNIEVLTQLPDGALAYRVMKNPRITKKKARLVKIGLDDGSFIRCTPNHIFYLKNGKNKEAINLINGDSIQSAYINNHKIISVAPLTKKEDVYCGTVEETNKFFIHCEKDSVLVNNCSEQPLPPYGACLLGSFNLVKYVNGASFNWDQFREDIPKVVRAMDNVIDKSKYPLYEQEKESKNKRRMGLGVTGLANTLESMGMLYGSEKFIACQNLILQELATIAYTTSILLAKEKGPFPMFSADQYIKSTFISRVVPELIKDIKKYGVRNSHLTSIAPTGTISMTADNVSSGIEPVFSYKIDRIYISPNGPEQITVEDYGYARMGVKGKQCKDVTIQEHLNVLKAATDYVDSAVSKTCNVPPSTPWKDFKNIYTYAWENGCKGCTTFQTEGKRTGILKDATCEIDSKTGKRDCD